jgi:hypothetical protein
MIRWKIKKGDYIVDTKINKGEVGIITKIEKDEDNPKDYSYYADWEDDSNSWLYRKQFRKAKEKDFEDLMVRKL